ncbi:hypothetical protein SAMN05216411_1155 [Nitrosospira multiformis]|nr:hypothetical protein SAMN05216411_1155 [Nitrosospira multiformis]
MKTIETIQTVETAITRIPVKNLSHLAPECPQETGNRHRGTGRPDRIARIDSQPCRHPPTQERQANRQTGSRGRRPQACRPESADSGGAVAKGSRGRLPFSRETRSAGNKPVGEQRTRAYASCYMMKRVWAVAGDRVTWARRGSPSMASFCPQARRKRRTARAGSCGGRNWLTTCWTSSNCCSCRM